MDTTTRILIFVSLLVLTLGGAAAAWMIFSVRVVLSTLAHDFPWAEPAPDSEQREGQRLAMGLMNVGATLVRDADHLHVTPTGWYARFGAERFSLPFEAMEIFGQRDHLVLLRLGRSMVWAPAWCVDEDLTKPAPDE